jgi:elongation factor P
MAIPATQIRRGMVIVFEGQPCKVLEFRHHTPGNLRAMIQTKLRNIRTGASFEHRFRSADTSTARHWNSTRWSISTPTARTTTS